LVASADVVTTTTSVDAERFRDRSPQTRTLVLSPGYEGARVAVRGIDRQTPRRVLVLGSYAWVAKQRNIHQFLRAAAGPLGAAGVGIDVVGSVPEPFAARLRREFPSVTITGQVDDLRPYFANARMGIVAEVIGGGFKLKALDYVFNRLPIVAIAGSVEGTPLEAGRSMLEFADVDDLVDGIRTWIDDADGLDALQEAAFRACDDQFSWSERGRRLAQELNRPS
jgi:glycosyltransferase involved in cell wall biosynthesis